MGTAAAAVASDGGKSAKKLDEALGGASRRPGAKAAAPVGVQHKETFGEAAAKVVGAETAALLAEFD